VAKTKAKEQRRESFSGYHYLNTFQTCPRKFFIKYIVGISTEFTAPPLLLGGAFHEGKAVWYTTGKEEKAVRKFQSELKSRRKEYEYKEEYENDLERGTMLLSSWITEVGYHDLEIYTVLAVEEMIEASLPNGFILTIRPDTILQAKASGDIYIMESKTTGFNPYLTEKGVATGDQATAYLWAVGWKHPEWKVTGVIPDVSFWSKSSKDVGRIKHHRGDIVFRNPQQLWEFEQSTMGLLVEISQKTKAVKSGNFHPSQVFPRNTAWCTSYNRPCEYVDICRKDLKEGMSLPPGFKHDSWAEERSVLDMNTKIKGEKYERRQTVGKNRKSA
jgi:hypothetical protein